MAWIKRIVAFFTDDLGAAAMVLGWIGLSAILHRHMPLGRSGSLVYTAGMVAILVHGTWRRAAKR
jgi:hypothetical protein